MEVNLKDKIDKPVFHTVGEAADSLGRPCYVVGGYVRDLLLGRHSKDVDFVTVGSGRIKNYLRTPGSLPQLRHRAGEKGCTRT